MQYVLVKTSHKVHHMNGKELESKSYLPHDLMHISYALVTHSREGFFADKANEDREEQVVGMMQGAYKLYKEQGESFSYSAVSAKVDEMLRLMEREPIQLTEEIIQTVFFQYEQLKRQWDGLKTGQSMTLEV